MQVLKKQWKIKSSNEEAVHHIWESLGKPHKSIAHLLAQRKLHDFDAAKRYFNPDLAHLHDAFLMKDMDRAVKRIENAFRAQENIMIYGDYDVDGTTSVALMYLFLKENFPNQILYNYIPDRFNEGYGISFQGIDKAKEWDCSLIIALDCGIRSMEQVRYAHSKNIDFIICDHHLPAEELPDAYAVLNPKRIDCPYPFKELSGCGVGFKLISALAEKNEIPFSKITKHLDLLALSIAADIVPLTDENRVLAFHGLKKINEQPCLAIQSIKKVTDFKGNYTITDLGFRIAPLINAAGRMKDALLSVQLFIESDAAKSEQISNELLTFNTSRRSIDKEILEETLRLIEEDNDFKNKKSIVLSSNEWHKGIIGIVASRLIEKYYKPTIILTESNGMYSGSGRSVHGFNIHEALEKCAHLLDKFGGHFFAAGMTLTKENLKQFKEEFESVVTQSISDKSLLPIIEIDVELELIDLTDRYYNTIQRFEPCGPENPSPIFKSKNVSNFKNGTRVLNNNHVKFLLTQDGENFISGIGFNLADKYESILEETDCFDIVYCLDKNSWNGKSELQIRVLDIRVNKESKEEFEEIRDEVIKL